VCFLRGPRLVFELANAAYFQLVGHRDILGKPVREALPEVEGQGYFELLDGLLASGEFEPAAQMLVRSVEQLPPWYPPLADLSERHRALEEFDRSRVVARVRSSRRFAEEHPSVRALVDQLMQHSEPAALTDGAATAPEITSASTADTRAAAAAGPQAFAAGYEVPAEAWSLARCDQRLTQRLGIF